MGTMNGRKVADACVGMFYLIMASLPPARETPARRLELSLAIRAHERQMLARLDSLNAAAHAGAARGYADLAAHHAEVARKAARQVAWLAPLAGALGAWGGYTVASWL